VGVTSLRHIRAFELSVDGDAEFVAGWDAARPSLEDALGSLTLFRALRRDVRLRFVELAVLENREAWEPNLSPFPSHPGLYEAVYEEGEPDGTEGVTLLNAFEAIAGDDDRFRAGWEDVRGVLAARQGYLGTRLYRAVTDADFRFVNQARWSSPLMYFRALNGPELQAAATALPFPSHPALYQPVRV
jgi:hypothetical protein